MSTTPERRRNARVSLAREAILYMGADRIDCRAIDIGTEGMSLLSPVYQRPGVMLRVAFDLGPGLRRIHAQGVLVHGDRRGEDAVLGIRFHALDPLARRHLAAFVDQRAREAATAADAREATPVPGPPPSRFGTPTAGLKRRPKAANPELLALYREALEDLSDNRKRKR